jgi:hypothetical protein
MPSFSLLKRIGREFSNSQQSRQQQQQVQEEDRSEAPAERGQPPILQQQNGSAKSPIRPPGAIGDDSAVAGDSDNDSGIGGVGGVGDGSGTVAPSAGNGNMRKERRNSKRDLLLRMIGKPPLTPLRGRAQSQPPTPQRSTTFAVSQPCPLLFQCQAAFQSVQTPVWRQLQFQVEQV